MTESVAQRDPVEQLAEDFMARLRRGERPEISEYALAYPDLADEIRDLFPALVVMEEVKPQGSEPGARNPEPGGLPDQLGDYRILREVARGGMGVVYEAEQVALGRHVALKVLPTTSCDDPLRLLRFRREARSAARLHHTNIVPVFDVGSVEGIHYYAMQFIQGQGLDEVLRELLRLRLGTRSTDLPDPQLTASLAEGLRTGVFDAAPVVPVPKHEPRPEPSAILTGPESHYIRSIAGLGVQAAEALAYAHGQRVLHRDVKPSNLLLDRQGTLWLTDFGLAKDDGDDLTRTGDIVGTLRYMAPERFKGVSDPRTDVYALGITLYELLTLRPAFDESDRVLLVRRITQDDPPRLRAINPTIPRDLETVVLKAIEKDPARRYTTAADMADDLRRFLTDRPIKARRASWLEQSWRWCRRNPGVAASLAAAFSFLLLLVVGLSIGGLLVLQAKRAAERSLGEAEQALYFQRIALADRELQGNNLARAEDLLALCPPELRGWEWHYLNRNRGRLPVPITLPRAVTGRGSLSPDGRRLAVGGIDGTVMLCDLTTGQIAEFPAHQAPCQVHFTPDGRSLVTADDPGAGNATVKVWDANSRELLRKWEYPHGVAEFVAVSPDGLRLAIVGGRKEVKRRRVDVWESTTGRHLTAVEGGHAESVWGLAFSPDGRLVASTSPDGVVRISDADSGRAVHEFRHVRQAGFQFWSLAFSPDGRRLGVGYGAETSKNSGGVRVWDVATGEVCGNLTGQIVSAIVFAPGGRMVSGGSDGTLRLWDFDSGQELLSFGGHTIGVRCLAFTPDGHKMVTVGEDRVIRVWDATPVRDGEQLGDERLTLRDHTDGVHIAQFLPGGHEVLTVSNDGSIRVHSLKPAAAPSRVLGRGEDPVAGVGPVGNVVAIWTRTWCRLVDARTGATQRPLEVLADEEVCQFVFSPDGRLVAGRDWARTVYVWDAATGDVRRLVRHSQWVYGLAFRPASRLLLTSVSLAGEVYVWDPTTGDRLAAFAHPAACAVAFSPDGRRMATAGWDRVVQLWDTSSDDPRQWSRLDAYADPTGGANVIAFSPDGKLLAWGGTDSVLKVWKLGSREVATLRGHRNWIWDVSFSSDGREILTASRDSTVKLWRNPFFPGGRP